MGSDKYEVFLTGSTGLLGINTVEAALSHGHEVMALVRDADKARRVARAFGRAVADSSV